jgi:isopenicillin N synthase-like dioxygenase
LDWADLVTVDLSQLSTPEGKRQQADILISAVREKGFFYVKNFGISQERVNRQFAMGKNFYELPLEEKLRYVPQGLGKLRGRFGARKAMLTWILQTRDSSMATCPRGAGRAYPSAG